MKCLRNCIGVFVREHYASGVAQTGTAVASLNPTARDCSIFYIGQLVLPAANHRPVFMLFTLIS